MIDQKDTKDEESKKKDESQELLDQDMEKVAGGKVEYPWNYTKSMVEHLVRD